MASLISDSHLSKYTPSKIAPGYPELMVIVGSGRSGTAFLWKAIRGGYKCPVYGEFQNIIPIYRNLHKYGDLTQTDNLRRLTFALSQEKFFKTGIEKGTMNYEEFHQRVSYPSYESAVYTLIAYITEKLSTDASLLVYKFPADVFHMELIAEILPSARFIHIIRDGRDVMLSLRKVQKWGTKTAVTGMHYWNRALKSGKKSGSLLGKERYFEIRYEDLIASPAECVPKLVQFISENPDDRKVEGILAHIGRQGDPSRIYTWKKSLNQNELRICEAVGWDYLQEYEYELQHTQRPALSAPVVIGSVLKDVIIRSIIRFKRFQSKRRSGK